MSASFLHVILSTNRSILAVIVRVFNEDIIYHVGTISTRLYYTKNSGIIVEAYSCSLDCDFISSMYPAVIIPAGSATTAIPKTEDIIVIILPTVLTA